MLELARFSVLAAPTQIPLVAHLAGTLHVHVEGGSGAFNLRREWLIESLLFFVVIGVFCFRSRRNGENAVGRDTDGS
jgi:hypothetical protein